MPNSSSTKRLDAVLPLAEAGIAVHYLKPLSKAPRLDNWSSVPRNTADDLARKFKPDLNFGIRLGEPSKIDGQFLYALDLDIRDPSKVDEARAMLEELVPEADKLPSVISGSGGASRHIYFLANEAFRSKKLAHSTDKITGADGKEHWAWEIELFGTGKQVACPPSIHPVTKKPYVWERPLDLEAIELGAGPTIATDRIRKWVHAEADDTADRTEDKAPLDLDDDRIKDTLARLPLDTYCEDREGWLKVGMALHHQYEGGEEGYDLWCEFSSQSGKFNEGDQRRVWESFKGKGPTTTFASLLQATRDSRLVEAFEELPDDDKSEESSSDDPFAELEEASEKPKSKLELVFGDELDRQTPPTDFIEGLLFDGQLSVVFGKPGSGKSFWTSDLAFHVAGGMEWNGRGVRKGACLIIVLEGLGGIPKRKEAWADYHKIDDINDWPIAWMRGSLDMIHDKTTVKSIVDACKAVEARRGVPVRWIIVDTLSRAMAGGDENSAEDMTTLVASADWLRTKTGAHVTLVHHSGKDEARGARGHSSLRGAVDTEIEIAKEQVKTGPGETDVKTVHVAKLSKQKDERDGLAFPFLMQIVDTGDVNSWGKPVTSIVIVPGVVEKFEDLEGALSPRAAAALAVARNLAGFGADDLLGLPEGVTEAADGSRELSVDVWRDALKDRETLCPKTEHARFRDLLRNVRKALTEKTLIEIAGDRLSVPPPV